MNITEEKWSIQQTPQTSQSPRQAHPSLSPQMSNISTEPFMPPFSYEGQTSQGQIQNLQMQANDGNNMIVTPKQEIATPQSNFVAVPASVTRQNVGSPVTPTTSNSAPSERKIDSRHAFTTSSFHASPFQSATVRKRRDSTMNFNDVGPFFMQTQQHYNLFNTERTNSYKICINSKVDRGFFLADNDWTCYRRNYFQISSAFSITGTSHPLKESDVQCLIEVNGQFLPVTQFLLGITARVSNSDKKIDLVQHTPKRDKGPQMVPMPKAIRPGGNLNLSSVGTNSNLVTFERIQFKTATANNGKRRAAQQYYVIMVELYAQTDCDNYLVATTISAPLVVRGRSPGHYADTSERFNPLAMHPSYPNDGRQHMNFPHPGQNGSPGVIPADFSGSPYPGAYGQYPPFQGFSQIMIPTNPSTSEASPFHQHQSHYIVHNIPQTGDNPSGDMFNNHNIDPNNIEVSTTAPSAFSNYDSRQTSANATSGGKPPLMKIEIPQTSHLPNHPLTSPAFHSQEYVELYNHNGHPANTAATHNGGYHSDSERHHSNGGSEKRPENPQQNPDCGQSENGSSQLNDEKIDPPGDPKPDGASPKSPSSTSEGNNATASTTQSHKGKASA